MMNLNAVYAVIGTFFSWIRNLMIKTWVMLKKFKNNSDESELRQKNIRVRLRPVIFHEKHAQNVRLWIDQQIAFRSYDFCNGYVFVREPIDEKKFFFVVQVLEIDKCHLGSIAFGVTTENPSDIRIESFPSNARQLNDKRSYLVSTNIIKSPSVGDVLIFYLNDENEMVVKVNTKPEEILFSLRKHTQYWCFLDLYGSTRKVRAYLAEESEIGSCQLSECGADDRSPSNVAEMSRGRAESRIIPPENPTLTLNCCINKIRKLKPVTTSLLERELTANSASVKKVIVEDPSVGYCIECFKNPCDDCILYPCGDFILCYQCALKLRGGSESYRCPKCLLTIENVTRIFRQ